jgi:predicted O-methyltransferase YrrM
MPLQGVALPYDSSSFDVVVWTHETLQSNYATETFVELARVVSNEGFIILATPLVPANSAATRLGDQETRDYEMMAETASLHLIRVLVDERGPSPEIVGIFAKQPVELPRRPSRLPQPARAAPRPRMAEHNLRQGATSYLDVLRDIHTQLAPSTYLEIGVHRGASLRLAACPSVAVDPDPRVTVSAPAVLYNETSDDFFRYDAHDALAQGADLAFIDGLHLFENVLRDFMNTERLASRSSVVVIDDVLPNHPAQALRERETFAWCGDVWKIAPCLAHYRPDLQLTLLDTDPTGLLVVSGLDPSNRVLWDQYDSVLDEYLSDHRATPPPEVFARSHAFSPGDAQLKATLRAVRAARS